MGNEIKALAACIVAFANAFGKAFEDGKLSAMDLFSFIKPIETLNTAIKSLPAVPAKLLALDEAGRAELKGYLIENFQIPEADVESMVDNALSAGFALWDVIAVFLPKPPVEGLAPAALAAEAPQA